MILEKLLSDEKYTFVSPTDQAFIVAFNNAMIHAGYENNGIQPYVVFGKYKIEYYKPGNKTKKYVARIYFREGGIVLRLYFSDIDKHRSYLEQAPDFIQKPFVDGSHRCKAPGCKGLINQNGNCRYRKAYTLNGVAYQKCAEESFCFYQLDAKNAAGYAALLAEFYPNKKRTA